MHKRLAIIIAILSFAARINAIELPDKINDWHSVSEYVQPLMAGDKDFGRCVYKDYVRESPRGNMQIILTEGKGTGSLYVPEHVNASKGVMPSSAGYEVISISNHKCIIERQNYMPTVLAMRLSEDIILTVEVGIDDESIIELAEELLNRIEVN